MTDTPQTAGERHIEKIMENLAPGSDRYQALASARQFKSSWVELGDQLLRVNGRNLYREWGYDSFEEYCVKEIRIKKATAEKLTLAYRYMERQEPAILEQRSELQPLPDYRSIDLLRQAREEKGFSDEEYTALRTSVIDEERSHPTVLKKFREVAATRQEPAADPQLPIKAAIAAARRLDTALERLESLPGGCREMVADLIVQLEYQLGE